MQHALGDGADLQQHMQTAASLGAYAQQQDGGGGTVVATSAAHASPSPAAAVTRPPQPNGSAQGTQGGLPRGGVLPAPRQYLPGAAHQALPSSSPNSTSGSGVAGFLPAPQGLTHPPPPGHHAWRVTSERQLQHNGGGGSSTAQTQVPADVPSGGGLTARSGRQPAQSNSMPAAAPRFPSDYSPLPGAAGTQANHVAPRRFFGDPGSSEIQPADDPPGPPMRFLHPPGGSYHSGGHGSTLLQRRGETYAQVHCRCACNALRISADARSSQSQFLIVLISHTQ